MQKDTKELLTHFGIMLTIGITCLGIVGLMSNCSIKVNRANYDMQACIQQGGEWSAISDADKTGYCVKAEKAK